MNTASHPAALPSRAADQAIIAAQRTLATEPILDHPEDAIQLVAGFPNQIEDAAKLAWRGRQQNQLFTSPETEAHGLLWMNPATWDQMAQFMKNAGQIPRVIPAQAAMTDQFIPAAVTP